MRPEQVQAMRLKTPKFIQNDYKRNDTLREVNKGKSKEDYVKQKRQDQNSEQDMQTLKGRIDEEKPILSK